MTRLPAAPAGRAAGDRPPLRASTVRLILMMRQIPCLSWRKPMGEVRRGVYALVLIGGLMVSCTSNQPPDGKNVITVTHLPASTGGAVAPPHFQVLETRDTLLAPYPVRWDSWSMVSQNELEFLVGSGLAICQAARVHLTELADEVRVGIEVGSKPEQRNPCALIGTTSRVVVKLSAPLGGRRVIDANR